MNGYSEQLMKYASVLKTDSDRYIIEDAAEYIDKLKSKIEKLENQVSFLLKQTQQTMREDPTDGNAESNSAVHAAAYDGRESHTD